MRTAKAISTISYNSVEFFTMRLKDLIQADIIEYAYFIQHRGENGDKDHIHAWMMPSKTLQTTDLKAQFNEQDARCPTKPLGCLPFRPSKVGPWIQYALHNPAYLRQHSHDDDGDGKIEYSIDQIFVVGVERSQLQRDYVSSLNEVKTDKYRALEDITNGGSLVDSVLTTSLSAYQIYTLAGLVEYDKKTGNQSTVFKDLIAQLSELTAGQMVQEMQKPALSDKKDQNK